MRRNFFAVLLVFLLANMKAVGQKRLENLKKNAHLQWVVDSLERNLILYYEKGSHAQANIELLKSRIDKHITNTLRFIGVDTYDRPIHYFVLDDRQKIKLLTGYETNGSANAKNNYITAIFSEKVNSVYSNHELFHLIAMNLWGYPEAWINEGMAVYSDNLWQGYDLHELSKYLIDCDKYIPLDRISKNLRKYDSMTTYPLLGSFARFIQETHGRDAIGIIWTHGRKKLKRKLGYNLGELEKEWLEMLGKVKYDEIEYPK